MYLLQKNPKEYFISSGLVINFNASGKIWILFHRNTKYCLNTAQFVKLRLSV